MSIIREKVQRGEVRDFVIDGDVLKLGHRLCVPQVTNSRRKFWKKLTVFHI